MIAINKHMAPRNPESGKNGDSEGKDGIKFFERCDTGDLRLLVIDWIQKYMMANGFVKGPFDFNGRCRQAFQLLMGGNLEAVKAHLAVHPGLEPNGMQLRAFYITSQVALIQYLIKSGLIQDEGVYAADYAELFEGLAHPAPYAPSINLALEAMEHATRGKICFNLAN